MRSTVRRLAAAARRLAGVARRHPAQAVTLALAVVVLAISLAWSPGRSPSGAEEPGGPGTAAQPPGGPVSPQATGDGAGEPGRGPGGSEGTAGAGPVPASGERGTAGGGAGGTAGTDRGAGAAPDQPGTGGTSAAAGCASTAEQVTVGRNQNPGARCLSPGGVLTVDSQPSPPQPWQPLSSSDGSVLSCTSNPGKNGSVEGTCRALRAGSAVVRTQTADAKATWQLEIQVY